MMMEQTLNSRDPEPMADAPQVNKPMTNELLVNEFLVREYRLEAIRQRINDETYLCAAIQRLALVMSNELMEINKEGGHYERKRRK